ncbi:hypothetical protein AAEU29_12595 [Pseudoalteromonas sp. SSM20]|uniref:hypothetical protein n=1 Tax=Pseudoalteromonas sp. SSM20 TaxID=3139394 RepID=UPI003BAADA0A
MTQFTAQFCNALKFINLTKVTNMCNCRLADVIVILEWEAFFLLFFLISLSKGYRHPDGIYSPEGVYGTLIPPFADTTQKALKQILYARPRNRQVTHFVTVDNDAR